MTNPATTDRRDVAHATNPIGGQDMIEKDRADSGMDQPLGQSGEQAQPASPTEEKRDRMDRQHVDSRKTGHVQSLRLDD